MDGMCKCQNAAHRRLSRQSFNSSIDIKNSHMPVEYKKKIYFSLAAAALMVFLLGQNHAGFILYFVLFALLFWIPYSVYVIYRRPDARASQLARVAIWLVAVALVVGIHYIRHETTRHNADEIAASINKFMATHSRCPVTLDEVGITQQQRKDLLGISGYSCEVGKPFLFYAVTYAAFDVFQYDFQTKSWEYRAD
jgi:hypothetical protein